MEINIDHSLIKTNILIKHKIILVFIIFYLYFKYIDFRTAFTKKDKILIVTLFIYLVYK